MRKGIKRVRVNGTVLIAPCGLNCRLCRAYSRERNPCPGCRVDNIPKPETRFRCAIKSCARLASPRRQFCDLCNDAPCRPVLHLDKRYRTKYKVSPIANLQDIRKRGVRKFAAEETEKWVCPSCGGVLCMHEPRCRICGHAWRDQ
jgi:hypothetical protein